MHIRFFTLQVQQPKVRIGIFYVDYGGHKIYLTNVLRIFEYPSVYLYLRDKTYPYNYRSKNHYSYNYVANIEPVGPEVHVTRKGTNKEKNRRKDRKKEGRKIRKRKRN